MNKLWQSNVAAHAGTEEIGGRTFVPVPEWRADDLPICDHERCKMYDGKFCALLRERPMYFCVPVLVSMAKRLNVLEEKYP